jgi:arylsulfatase A-like enzyme
MINRRDFLQIAGASLLGAQTRAAKPNIIFILADDLGYGDVGCYGQRRIKTPNIDRLAVEGTRFTQGYSGATVCAPSRCSLMTGKHGGHATVRGNHRPEFGIRPDEATVASVLKSAGYRNAVFGKWGLGGPGTGSVPQMRGFDEFFGYLDQLHAHNYYPEHVWEGQDELFLTANWFERKKQYVPDLVTEHSIDFINRQQRQNPFFIYLTYTIPHANNERGGFNGNGMDVPSDEPYTRESWPQVEKNFAAMITRMDGDIGRIMALLKQRGMDDNTLVVFTSDNGAHQEGGHDPKFFSSSGPLRGIKRDLYEGGIRIPYITRWPGRIPAGRVSDWPLAFWDFLPTAAELAGVAAPQGIDGISMVPALTGGRQPQHEYFYWEFYERGFQQAVRMGNWKGVKPKMSGPVELYDLEIDIGEKNDVAARNPGVVKKIESIMASAHVDNPNFPVREAGRSAGKKK